MTSTQLRDLAYDAIPNNMYWLDGRQVSDVIKRGDNQIVITFVVGPDKVITF